MKEYIYIHVCVCKGRKAGPLLSWFSCGYGFSKPFKHMADAAG